MRANMTLALPGLSGFACLRCNPPHMSDADRHTRAIFFYKGRASTQMVVIHTVSEADMVIWAFI